MRHHLGTIVRSSIFTLLTLLASQVSVLAQVTTMFSDDFSGPTLDTTKWGIGAWQIGRTDLDTSPVVNQENGVTYVTLQLDTYHPDFPGALLRGAEIYSLNTFALPKKGQGVQFEARVRLRTETRGLIASSFTWGGRTTSTTTLSDEIDFEYLTNFPVNQVLLTSWNDWDYKKPVYNDGIHHSEAMIAVGGLNRNTWTTLQLRWLKDRTEWYVNGVLAWSTKASHANDPMSARFNFWAPDASWIGVYDSGLQPALTPDQNVSYFYDVDYIRVTKVP
jgi:hypothetical protein